MPTLDDEERQRWRQEAAGALETARLAEAGGRHNWACFLAARALAQAELVLQVTDGLWLQLRAAAADSDNR